MSLKKLLIILTTFVLLQGCGLGYISKSKPDRFPPNDPTPHKLKLSRYGNPKSYKVSGVDYYLLPTNQGYTERGVASWYGDKFHGRRTSSWEPYNMYAMTAAHKTLPIPVYAQVTNLENGRKVIVKINDRGPFVKSRLIDLSFAAATKLGIVEKGTAPVEVTTIIPASTSIAKQRIFQKQPPLQQEITATNSKNSIPAIPVKTTSASTPTAKLPTPKVESTKVAAIVVANTLPTKVFSKLAQTMPKAPYISKPENPPVPAISTQKSTYFLQIGAFSDKKNALRLIERVKLHNNETFTIETTDDGKKQIHKVVIGPINTIEKADLLMDEMEEFEIKNSRLIISN